MDAMATLRARRAANTPELTLGETPLASLVIHGLIALGLLAALMRAIWANDVFAWSVGLAWLAYDTAQTVFFILQSRHITAPQPGQGGALPMAVIIAAHNEAQVLPATIAALAAQIRAGDTIIIADDGSSDGTAAMLHAMFGLETPLLGEMSAPSPQLPALRWLRLPHGGKAAALNAAIGHAQAEIVVTVDADTLAEAGALDAIRHRFVTDTDLVAASGVLLPEADSSLAGRLLQGFQTQEYVRNFLGRFAWGRLGVLVIISGAFGAYRLQPLRDVGGFDPSSLVEDYELIHRLHRHGAAQGLRWRSDVIGAAVGRTDAPSGLLAFLRQRRRWFGGFLRTQFAYREMVGNPQMGKLGLLMLPVKALDAFQPLFILSAAALVLIFALGGHWQVLRPVGVLIALKMALDFSFQLLGLRLFRRWTGHAVSGHPMLVAMCAALEPLSFLLLRNLGAASGWVAALTGARSWARSKRSGLLRLLRS